MKLSDYIEKFDKMDADLQANSKNILTKDQADIFRDVLKTYNTEISYGVLDGASGCGKSVLIRAIKKYCDTNNIICAVTASTGKASSALDGQTIHSFMGLSMVQNDDANNKDDALKLSFKDNQMEQIPDILIIDEASMIGQKLFAQIDKARFNYVLFVMDSNQLPPVKEKSVEWGIIADRFYTLTKTLRAKEPRLSQLFTDFKLYKEEKIEELDLKSYINGDNIVTIDFKDIDTIPANSECCFVGYRNKLVENLVKLSTHDNHTMENLNTGVSTSWMVSTSDVPNDNGYFPRDFVNEQSYYNGEDVEVIKLGAVVDTLVDKGYAMFKNFKLSMNKKKTGLTIVNMDAPIKYGQKESIEAKQFLQFPDNEVLEYCTLSIIDGKIFTLIWDESEDEFNDMLDYYFSILRPHITDYKLMKNYFKDRTISISTLPYEVQQNLKTYDRKQFFQWYEDTDFNYKRKQAWGKFLSAQKVVSSRPTTSRTVHKAQGISVPAVVITDQSFYGASRAAEYVAVTRGKHGLILVENTPKELVTNKGL